MPGLLDALVQAGAYAVATTEAMAGALQLQVTTLAAEIAAAQHRAANANTKATPSR
jgi:hypothetical protein